jgi:hypothetical protein
MAMSYWYKSKPDSAIWAFREGKKRGGFGNFILELNKSVLDACSKNSILISSGDNFSIPLWYLQIVEKYRTDVAVVDIALLHTTWYPKFLSKEKVVSFDLPQEVLDTIEYKEWKDTLITINNFSWTVKPSYYDQYVLRGDRVFLSLLKANKFQRTMYFTVGFYEQQRLSLTPYLTPLVVIDQLTTGAKNLQPYEDYKKTVVRVLNLSSHLSFNSPDEQRIFDIFRYNVLEKIRDLLTKNDNKKAKELMALLDKYADERKFPYQAEEGRRYADYLKQEVKNAK